MISLSERLMAIAGMVTPCGVAADIGCDHCFTLLYLVENGICQKGLGSDVKPGPIEKGRENVCKSGFGDKIELRLGSGLKTVKPHEAEALIISGMGGELINEIIAEGLETAKTARELIIQPQNRVYEVRRNLHTLGFQIADEKIVFEQGKYYNIIKAFAGAEKYEEEAHYLYGKILIHRKEPLLARRLQEALAKNAEIAGRLSEIKTEKSAFRLAEIEKENSIIGEVLSWL